MEWWQALIALGNVGFGSLLGYGLARLGAEQERKRREKEQLRNAVSSMSTEAEAILRQSGEHYGGENLPPFPTDAWDVHRGVIIEMPVDLQDSLQQLYLRVREINTTAQRNIYQSRVSGALSDPYRRQKEKVKQAAELARTSLKEWLQRH